MSSDAELLMLIFLEHLFLISFDNIPFLWVYALQKSALFSYTDYLPKKAIFVCSEIRFESQ